jgi:hypothetical protein
MGKLSRQNAWQAIAFLACAGTLWIHMGNFGGSEFSGGWLTGKLLTMADIGALLFLTALVFTIFVPTAGVIVALVAIVLCLPFYLYIVMGPYRRIFYRRILRPATQRIRLEQLGFRWNHHASFCRRLQHSSPVREFKGS